MRTFHPFFDRDQSAIEADPAVKVAVTREHFAEIDASDVLYAVMPGGYLGSSVLIETTYAFALGKPVVCSETVSDYGARPLVADVLAPDAFLGSLERDTTRERG